MPTRSCPSTPRIPLVFLFALLALRAPAARAQDSLPVVRSHVSAISVRDGEIFRAGSWTLDSSLRPDLYRVGLIAGRPHRVAFLTDVDSISFMVEEGREYDFVVQKDGTPHHVRLVGTRAVPVPGIVRGHVTVAANPEWVCHDERPTPYLNFDLVVRNGTDRQVQVTQVRALVFNPAGELVERRVLGQQALELLGGGRSVGPLSHALMYNPFMFNAVRADSRIRYEIDLAGAEARTVDLTVRPRDCATQARLVLPLAGRIAVFDGHDVLSHHRRSPYTGRWARNRGIVDNVSRFSMDLVVVDADGRGFRTNGGTNEDWLSWGHPVRAAGAGTVAAVRDGQPDNDQVGSENRWTSRSLEADEMAPAGNYVLIDHGHGEFSLASHLMAGSVRVRPGQRVAAGEVVAQVGNSGSSLGPHLHYELRSGWGVRGIRGLPAYFHDLTVLGTGEGARGRPVLVNTGDVLIAR